MKTITVEVTDKHIAKGSRGWATLCPIAHAIREAGRFSVVTVGGETGHIFNCGLSTEFTLPYEAIGFVHDFDNKIPVKPFSFRLRYDEGAN